LAAAGLLIAAVKYRVKIKTFLSEVKQELTKVSWSTRQELMGATVVVIAVTGILTLFIGIIDAFLSKGLRILFR
jgi:preprotein translocase subunit SecE